MWRGTARLIPDHMHGHEYIDGGWIQLERNGLVTAVHYHRKFFSTWPPHNQLQEWTDWL